MCVDLCAKEYLDSNCNYKTVFGKISNFHEIAPLISNTHKNRNQDVDQLLLLYRFL